MKKFFNRLIEGRQKSANMEIARMIQATEYRNETPEYILDRLNNASD